MPHVAGQLSRRFTQCRPHDQRTSSANCVRRPFELAAPALSYFLNPDQDQVGQFSQSQWSLATQLRLLYFWTPFGRSCFSMLARTYQRFPEPRLERSQFGESHFVLLDWRLMRGALPCLHGPIPFGRGLPLFCMHTVTYAAELDKRSARRNPSAAPSCPHASIFLPGHRSQLLQRREAVVDFKSLLIAGLD